MKLNEGKHQDVQRYFVYLLRSLNYAEQIYVGYTLKNVD